MEWHGKKIEAVFQELNIRPEPGLTGDDASRRLAWSQ